MMRRTRPPCRRAAGAVAMARRRRTVPNDSPRGEDSPSGVSSEGPSEGSLSGRAPVPALPRRRRRSTPMRRTAMMRTSAADAVPQFHAIPARSRRTVATVTMKTVSTGEAPSRASGRTRKTDRTHAPGRKRMTTARTHSPANTTYVNKVASYRLWESGRATNEDTAILWEDPGTAHRRGGSVVAPVGASRSAHAEEASNALFQSGWPHTGPQPRAPTGRSGQERFTRRR